MLRQVFQPPINQPPVYQVPPFQAPTPQIQGVSKTDFENYVKANDAVLKNVQNQGQNLQNQMANVTSLLTSLCNNFKNSASTSNSGTLPSQTVTNPRQQINAITTRSGKTLEEPSTPLVPTPVISIPQKEPEQNPETSTEKVQNPNLENTAHVPSPEEEESIFIEIPKPKAKKTVNLDPNSPNPNSYQSKLPYPERMKVRENDKPSAQHSRFLKMFKQLRLEIGLKDALVEMPKFNKWLSSLLRNKEKLEEIAITTVNAECSAIIMNKVPEKLEDPGKFLIPCALQELNRTSALADSGASINLLPHSIYKKLGLEALTPTRMTLELANRSITHPMGIAEDVVVRVDGVRIPHIPNSYQSKLPYPERMKVRENDKPSAQHSRFLKMFKQLRLEIGLKDALVEMPKFNKWLSLLLRNKEKLEEIAITTVNAECSAIIMNKVPKKLEDPGKFLIPCALQELDRTSALADSGASINLLPHSIYKQLGLGALTPTRMTLELANRSITHPMGIAEDVVLRVDGFTFLADFVVVNFVLDPRVPIILGRPFLRTAKALIDLYEETLTLRVGKEELVYYADKSEKNKDKHFVHAIYVIDFSKDEPFSGSTTNHSDALPPNSSPVKTSDNLEEFADELTLLKKDVHEENFQVYSNPFFEFDDYFTPSNENPLFNEMDEDVKNKNSNISDSDEPILLNTPLTDKVECSDSEDDIDEIDAFLAMENLLSDDTTHNLAPEVISDHESIHNSSITFSPRSDPLHHEFAGEIITLHSRNDHEFEEYLSLMTVLCEISTSRSQENVHANPSSIIESLPVSFIPVEDSELVQEEIDIFLVPDDLIPLGVENDDS
ncbi:reverse transcriptase domain-containing protein, partial [Tanacetum coccineum]